MHAVLLCVLQELYILDTALIFGFGKRYILVVPSAPPSRLNLQRDECIHIFFQQRSKAFVILTEDHELVTAGIILDGITSVQCTLLRSTLLGSGDYSANVNDTFLMRMYPFFGRHACLLRSCIGHDLFLFGHRFAICIAGHDGFDGCLLLVGSAVVATLCKLGDCGGTLFGFLPIAEMLEFLSGNRAQFAHLKLVIIQRVSGEVDADHLFLLVEAFNVRHTRHVGEFGFLYIHFHVRCAEQGELVVGFVLLVEVAVANERVEHNFTLGVIT